MRVWPRVASFLAALGWSLAGSRAGAGIAPGHRPVFQKGFSFAAWTADGFASTQADEQLAEMKAGGVRWVSIVTLWQQATKTSVDIHPVAPWTSTDESLHHIIGEAHRLGLKVMLKPQIDLAGQGWRGEIAFQSEDGWSAWFMNYRRFIRHYADLAVREHVELLCVGVELDGTRLREKDWRGVIADVRKRYGGALTYATNWSHDADIAWWDALDYVGVDAYYPLASKDGCTVEGLKVGWRPHFVRLRDIARRTGKPILFTEIGYRSASRAAIEPWEWALPQPVSLEEQRRLYQATLETFWDAPWFAGAYWWLWEVRKAPDPGRDAGYSVRGKPAWDVLRAWYGKRRMAPTTDSAGQR